LPKKPKMLNGLKKEKLTILKPPSSKELKTSLLVDSLLLSYNPELKSNNKSSLKSPNTSTTPKKPTSKLKV